MPRFTPFNLSLPRLSTKAALGAAAIGSAIVHAGLVVFLVTVRLEGPRPTLVDAPATQLTLAPTPPRPAPPAPKPAEPAPAPPTPPPAEPPLADKPKSLPLEALAPTPVIAAPASPRVSASPSPPPPPPPAIASFAGVQGTRAKRVVYVMDGSAAMLTTLPYVQDELVQSVSRLDASQSFQIIVFRDPPASGRPTPALERFSATDFTPALGRAGVASWVRSIRPVGSSVPLEGLRSALMLHPDLIFLLTCSIPRSQAGTWGEGNAATLAALDALNPADASGKRATVIKAVQLLADDPTGLLQAIAAAHGDGPGSYRVLTLDDLNGR